MKCTVLAVVVKIVQKRQTSASMTDYAVSSIVMHAMITFVAALCLCEHTIIDHFCLAQTGKVAQAPSDTDAGTPTTKPNPGQPHPLIIVILFSLL